MWRLHTRYHRLPEFSHIIRQGAGHSTTVLSGVIRSERVFDRIVPRPGHDKQAEWSDSIVNHR
jgi:hypothetical protein